MDSNLFSLEGRIIVVTGGTGHLGREISMGLARFGAHVIAVARHQDRFPELESAQVECVSCDVQDGDAFTKVVADVQQRHGRIDGLINNASAAKRETWDELDADAWNAGLEATLNHYFTCTKTISAHMLARGRGAILNIASIFGFLAPTASIYPEDIRGPSAHHAAAKAGILQLTKYLAAQWAGRGIRVNAISPGWFPQKRGPERPDFMEAVQRSIPMGRIGQPSELIGATVFLMGDAASYITGQNLVVDGGYSIR